MTLETKHLTLKRIGWLYPIFRDVYFYHGLLAALPEDFSPSFNPTFFCSQ